MKGTMRMFIDLGGQLVGSLSDNVPNIIHTMVGDYMPDDDEGLPVFHSRQFEGTITVYVDCEGGFAGFTISGLIPKEGQ